MKLKPLSIVFACLALVQSSFAVSSVADVLTGVNGQVVIGEFATTHATTGVGLPPNHYYVDIVDDSSGLAINGFAVSTSVGSLAFTGRSDWGADTVLAADWSTYVAGLGGQLASSSFASLFGDAEAVNFYYNNGGGNITVTTDQDQAYWADDLYYISSDNQFGWYDSPPASDFVAFDVNGTILDQSRTGSVPDAGSTFAMTTLALAALGAASRRWRE